MKSQYSKEFKMEAVKRVIANNGAVTKVAEELGLKSSTLQTWVTRSKTIPDTPFPGSGYLSTADDVLRKLEKENRNLKEENEILKKAAAYFAKNLK